MVRQAALRLTLTDQRSLEALQVAINGALTRLRCVAADAQSDPLHWHVHEQPRAIAGECGSSMRLPIWLELTITPESEGQRIDICSRLALTSSLGFNARLRQRHQLLRLAHLADFERTQLQPLAQRQHQAVARLATVIVVMVVLVIALISLAST